MFKIDSKVRLCPSLLGQSEGMTCTITGTVVGYGHKREFPLILVELDEGFYDPSKAIYVSVLAVHADNLLPIV
jgi:hypothetical protein